MIILGKKSNTTTLGRPFTTFLTHSTDSPLSITYSLGAHFLKTTREKKYPYYKLDII